MQQVIDVSHSSGVKTKQLLVKPVNGEGTSQMVEVFPGLTVGELRNQLGLGDGFVLSLGDIQQNLKDSDVLFPLIKDGDVLFVSASIRVGKINPFI